MKRRRISQKNKGYFSLATFIAWLAFITIWLFFYAVGYGIFENIAITISSFLIIGAINAVFWIPASAGPNASGTRTKFAALVAIGWMIFILMWWPFYGEFFTLYENYAISLLSFVIMLVLFIVTFATVAGIGMGSGEAAKFGVIIFGWLGFLIIWLWYYAASYTGYNNIAIGLLSLVVAFILFIVILRPIVKRDDSEMSWKPTVVGFAWIGFLIVWFWQFADTFTLYQNIAVFIISIMAMAAIGFVVGKTSWDDLDDLDYEEIEE